MSTVLPDALALLVPPPVLVLLELELEQPAAAIAATVTAASAGAHLLAFKSMSSRYLVCFAFYGQGSALAGRTAMIRLGQHQPRLRVAMRE
jgi:hypothetical protein